MPNSKFHLGVPLSLPRSCKRTLTLLTLPRDAVFAVLEDHAFFGEFVANDVSPREVPALAGIGAFGNQLLNFFIADAKRSKHFRRCLAGAAFRLRPFHRAT